MSVFGNKEAQDRLSHANVRVPRLCEPSELLTAREGIWMDKVGGRLMVAQQETHSTLALRVQERESSISP